MCPVRYTIYCSISVSVALHLCLSLRSFLFLCLRSLYTSLLLPLFSWQVGPHYEHACTHIQKEPGAVEAHQYHPLVLVSWGCRNAEGLPGLHWLGLTVLTSILILSHPTFPPVKTWTFLRVQGWGCSEQLRTRPTDLSTGRNSTLWNDTLNENWEQWRTDIGNSRRTTLQKTTAGLQLQTEKPTSTCFPQSGRPAEPLLCSVQLKVFTCNFWTRKNQNIFSSRVKQVISNQHEQ